MQERKISRREFITIAGGVTGIAALSSLGLFGGWGENRPESSLKNTTRKIKTCDVLVIGGGMAALFAAVKAHDAGAKVIVVSKGRLGSSGATPFAKGFFVYDPKTAKYSLDEFVELVGRSAIDTNNPVYTRQMAEHSKACAEELREWGFFNSVLYDKPFRKPIDQRGIPVVERVMITHLIKENNRAVGAAGFSIDEPRAYFFNAKAVILCTGAGGFKPNGFPIRDLTHDGTAAAYRIGAKITGKEWNDGHWTRADYPAACFNSWGDMFTRKPGITGVEIHHDLGVELNYLAYVKGNPVKMGPPGNIEAMNIKDGPYRPPEFNRRFPERKPARPDRERGHRPRKGEGPPPGGGGSIMGGASAGMSIHKAEGLVPIDDRCASNIPGLYAAGDALGSHMSGGIYTQIGSSLAGSAVQGAIAGKAAAEYAAKNQLISIPKNKIKKIENEIFAPLRRDAGYGPSWVTQTLKSIMIPNFVLYIKKESILKAALAYVEELRDHHLPMLRAADLHELRLAHETMNMVLNAEMKLRASLMRTESRCSHYRLDYPKPDFENWQAWINIYKDKDGSMKLEKQPFSTWR